MPEVNYTPKVRQELLAMFAAADAVTDAAIARVDARGTEACRHGGSVVIEHRNGTGTVRRYYATEATLGRMRKGYRILAAG